MNGYTATGRGVLHATTDYTILNLYNNSSGQRRCAVTAFTVSCGATPADAASLWEIRRTTAAGSGGSSVTPVAMDGAGQASLMLAKMAYAGANEPTFDTLLYEFALHQKALIRWVAAWGKPFVIPATANHGIAARSIESNGGVASHSVVFEYEE